MKISSQQALVYRNILNPKASSIVFMIYEFTRCSIFAVSQPSQIIKPLYPFNIGTVKLYVPIFEGALKGIKLATNRPRMAHGIYDDCQIIL